MEYDKKFLIIGNKNALTYKEVFPLIKGNKMWLGYNSPEDFLQPDGAKKKMMKGLTRWFTNLDIPKCHIKLIPTLKYEFANHPELYQKYDNYDAINIDKIKDIPYDYYGKIGVPITFIDKYNPDEFNIIGQGCDNLFTSLKDANRLDEKFINNYYKNGGTGNYRPGHPVLGFYDINGVAKIPYMRIIIQRNLKENE